MNSPQPRPIPPNHDSEGTPLSEPTSPEPTTGIPTHEPTAPEPATLEPPSGPYLPTIVAGLVVVTIAVLIGLSQLTDIEIDLGLVLPVGMVAAGALLVLGAGWAAIRGVGG